MTRVTRRQVLAAAVATPLLPLAKLLPAPLIYTITPYENPLLQLPWMELNPALFEILEWMQEEMCRVTGYTEVARRGS